MEEHGFLYVHNFNYESHSTARHIVEVGRSSIERGSSRSHMNPDETGVREVKE
jgi:hypothetical protein